MQKRLEKTIGMLLLKGMTTKQIAQELNLDNEKFIEGIRIRREVNASRRVSPNSG